jgi:heptosyltransferase II
MTSDSASVRRLVVLSPNWLGDAVMALPAIADTRRRFPNARLSVAARRSVADLFTMVRGVDQVVALEWNGKLQQHRALRQDIAAIKALEADATILLPNAFSAAWLVRRAGIGERWGYSADFRRPLLSRAVSRPRHSMHQAEYYQHLVRQLGMDSGPLEPAVLVPDDVVVGARMLLNSRNWDKSRPLVAIAPGAAYGTAKRWLPEHYASLVSSLVHGGAQCVLVGSKGDVETTNWIQRLLPDNQRQEVLDLTGLTSLSLLVGVIAIARAFVSNDSGSMHLAAAVGTPVTAIFGPTREYETRPLPRAGARVQVLLHDVWCRPCMLRECPIDHRCMKGLSPDRVLITVRESMADSLPGPQSRTRPTAS